MNSGLFAVGVVVILLGLFAFVYSEGGGYPYRTMGISGVIIGIVLLIAGAAVPGVITETRTTSHEVPIKRKTIVREEV